MPSHRELLARVEAAGRALGGVLDRTGELEGFPAPVLRFGPPAAPALLVDAGLHGEEPASCLGLAEWLERDAAAFADRLRVTALPCLNPHGFERGTRGSRDHADLNRLFDRPAAAVTRHVAAALDGQRFALAMDLHEDSDFLGFYLYELKDGPPFLGERIVETARALAPVSDGEEVGPFRTDAGLLRPAPDPARLRAREGWPIAFFLFTHVASHVVTVETPGRRPLGVRIELQRRALSTACGFLLAPSP